MRIVHSRLVDYYRSASRRPQMISGEGDPERGEEGLLAQAREPSAGPAQHAMTAEMRDRILREIAGMDEKFRTILHLRLIGEQSTEEIARSLGIGASSVRMRLFRGIRMLRKVLKQFEIG
jgi:RNA polymerase sigma factor (sigma-70 family)